MTYMYNGKQYIIIPVGAKEIRPNSSRVACPTRSTTNGTDDQCVRLRATSKQAVITSSPSSSSSSEMMSGVRN